MRRHVLNVAAVSAVPLAAATAGLLRTKVLATTLSPAAFGVFGLVLSFQNVVGSFLALGFGPALTRAVASQGPGRDVRLLLSLVFGAGVVTITLAVVAALALSLLADELSGLIGGPSYGSLLRVAAVGIPFALLANLMTFAIQGLQASRAFMVAGTVAAVSSAGVIAFGALVQGLTGAVVGAVVASMIGAGVYTGSFLIIVLRRRNLHDGVLLPSPLEALFRVRELAPTALAAFLATVLIASTPYLLRFSVSQAAGLDAAGVIHGAASISFTLMSISTAGLGWYMFPRLSEVALSPERLEGVQNMGLGFGIAILLPVASAVIIAREPITALLLSPSLAPVAGLLPGMVIAEFAYFAQWTIFATLLAARHLRAFVAMEGLRAFAIAVLVFAGAAVFGAEGAPWAYAMGTLLSLFAGSIYQARSLEVRISGDNMRYLFASAVILGGLTGVTAVAVVPHAVALILATLSIPATFLAVFGLAPLLRVIRRA